MPVSYPQTYFPILLQIFIAMAVAGGMVAASFFIGKRVRNPVKDMPYECGIVPTGSARERFSVRFYLVAMVFILFDIEAIFLYPWAVAFDQLALFGLIEMFLFIITVLVVYAYVWRRRGLEWD